jgi:heme-degrading monooxygenase HmoA
MIVRIWHGWSSSSHADEYETLLRTDMLPGMHRIQGFQGAYLLRRADGSEVEFVTITMFDDLDSVKRFAGEDYETAVLHPDARRLLTHFDPRSVHYEVRLTPDDVRRVVR